VQYEQAPSRFDRFRELVLGLRLRRGDGLVGRVMTNGEPEFTNDIAADLSAYKAPLAENLGIRTTAVFPILTQERVGGVFEFFSDKRIELSEQMRASMVSVGTLVGRVIERKQAELALREREERLRAVLNTAADAIINIDKRGIITDVNPATEQMYGYTRDELVGQSVKTLMPPQYHDEHENYITRYLETGEAHIIGMGRDEAGKRKDGSTFPISLAVTELDHLGLFTGFIRDISQRKALEKQVVDAAAEEQRRIGQDIHDGVGQELTGLRYMAQTHAESLAQQSSPDAQTAERMTQWLTTVQQQLRAIIRQLVPVEVDKQGLVAALRGLAQQTSENHDLVCEFHCQRPVTVADAALATHLYRIVQEAVANAVRHAQAMHIGIELTEDEDALRLQVTDDGIGIRSTHEMSTGIGLRSMAYRAGLIGAILNVRAREHGGTQVSCTVLRGHCGGWRMPEQETPMTG